MDFSFRDMCPLTLERGPVWWLKKAAFPENLPQNGWHWLPENLQPWNSTVCRQLRSQVFLSALWLIRICPHPLPHPQLFILSTLLKESPQAFSKFLYSGTCDLLFTCSKKFDLRERCHLQEPAIPTIMLSPIKLNTQCFACSFETRSLGWPRTPYVDEIGPELIEFCLLLPPESAGIKAMHLT